MEELKQRWNNICDVAAAREEDMKQIRVELECYQAEYDRVTAWLDTQEERLLAVQVFHIYNTIGAVLKILLAICRFVQK